MEMGMHQIDEATAFLKRSGFGEVTYGLVLGTGLSAFLSHLETLREMSYQEIPHFPIATMDHPGKLILGKIGDKKVIVMKGRLHYYEGYSMQEISFPIRVLRMLGVKNLFISNAAGALSPELVKGDIVLIKDHINLLPENPLRGFNLENIGPRFPIMKRAYDLKLRHKLKELMQEAGLEVKEGIYVAVQGPSLETEAECQYLASIGGTMVGMSTVPEVITARHAGITCLAISVISNNCLTEHQDFDLEESMAIASRSDQQLCELLAKLIAGQ